MHVGRSEMFDFTNVSENLIPKDTEGCGKCYDCLSSIKHSSGLPLTAMMMVLCPDCGNKRCPHSTHHDNLCTGSNDTGQTGSRYA
jgi:flavoprotein